MGVGCRADSARPEIAGQSGASSREGCDLGSGRLVWPIRIAAALGDTDDAVRLLDQAFRIGFFYSVRFHREPWWDPVCDNSAFQALIRPR